MDNRLADLERLKQVIFEYMLSNEVSQRKMAARIGINTGTLGYFLAGKRTPGFVTTAKMINFFKRENAKYENVDWQKDGLA